MANFTTTADLKAGALELAGELSNGNSDFDTQALTQINNLYQAIIAGGNEFNVDLGEAWDWAKAANPSVLELVPAYATGTVSLTKGSTSGTFNTAPGAGLGSLSGRFIKVDDRPEYFRIASHSSGAGSFTLDANYTGDTGGTLGFKAIKIDYTLTTGLCRLIAPFRIYKDKTYQDEDDGMIPMMDYKTFSQHYPFNSLGEGIPSRFCVMSETNGLFVVRFNAYVSTETRVEYDYIPVPTDLTSSPDTTPIIPRPFRVALMYGAVYYLMVQKSDSRADAYMRMTQAKLQALVSANRRQMIQGGRDRGRLLTRLDYSGLGRRRFIIE